MKLLQRLISQWRKIAYKKRDSDEEKKCENIDGETER